MVENTGLITQIRNRDLTKVEVTVDAPVPYDYARKLLVLMHFREIPLKQFAVALEFDGHLPDYYPDHKPARVRSMVTETTRLAHWFVLTGRYKQWPVIELAAYPRLIISNSIASENSDFTFVDHQNRIEFDYPPLGQLRYEEHKIARRVILHELYEKPHSDEVETVRACYMAKEIVDGELSSLIDGNFVRAVRNPSQTTGTARSAILSLTLAGREFCERDTQKSSNRVFIIAACDDKTRSGHDNVLTAYKETVREFGLDPKFQEHEEPEKNIFLDIFDYIDSSDFVVADITYNRFNCYIEIGYAMAKQKPILLFVEEDCLKGAELAGKVPFDISVVKYQTYSRSNLDDLKSKLRERIRVLRGRVV